MNELNKLIKLSKYAGERFDLVQAGGGNSSVKLENGEMLIKASGFILSDVEINNGYSKVLTKQISEIINNKNVITEKNKRNRENITNSLVKDGTISKLNRPSIETLLHSFLYKYTLHTHPIVVNMVVIKKNWKNILSKIFNKDKIALVSYKTPGIELALELNKVLKSSNEIHNIIFLQNHGLIITSSKFEDIKKINEYVIEKIESFLKVDFYKYKLTNKISALVNILKNDNNISYLSEDYYLNEQIKLNIKLFDFPPFCPDGFVFCGFSPVKISNLDDHKIIKSYFKKNFELPKIIIYKKMLFFIAQNVKKAKEMEEVMKFHISVLNESNKKINLLEKQELMYLSNWEAEKFRQNI